MSNPKLSKRAFWSLTVLAVVLLGVHTARSEGGAKVWRDGDLLTAADLNTSFAAVQPAAPAPPLVWSGFKRTEQDFGWPAPDGRVASFSFSSPVDGFAWVTASFEIRIRNSFDSARENCEVGSLISDSTGFTGCAVGEFCQLEGYARNSISANLPTQDGGGPYLSISQSSARVLPVKRGTNTFFLNGRHDCRAAQWGSIQFSALQVQQGMPGTVTLAN
jgi:hypothetical protein